MKMNGVAVSENVELHIRSHEEHGQTVVLAAVDGQYTVTCIYIYSHLYTYMYVYRTTPSAQKKESRKRRRKKICMNTQAHYNSKILLLNGILRKITSMVHVHVAS